MVWEGVNRNELVQDVSQMKKYYKRVNNFRFLKPGKHLINCGIISFERGISPVGLGYSDVSLETRGGRSKEYRGHSVSVVARQTLETDMSRTVITNPV